MPLDTGLLYGEMLASGIAHAAIPLGIVLIINPLMITASVFQKSLIFFGLYVLLSFLAQICFLLILQINACSGLNNFRIIVGGAVIAAVISAVMVAIPVFIEPMRVMVSQYIIWHRPLLTGKEKQRAEVVNHAVDQLRQIDSMTALTTPDIVDTVRELDINDYGEQTLREISIGASYWGAFAGAYGVAFGSLIAATCPVTV